MGIEAKPPVRRGQGGAIVVAIVAVAVCVPLLIVAALTVSWLFARTASSEVHVVHATPTYYDAGAMMASTVSPEFEARLNAAGRIQMTTERDGAFAVLAGEFAQSADEATRAVQGIQDTTIRDTAAWDAAKRFSDLNRPQDSTKMIEMMLDQSTRDAGFRAVATGDWPDRPVAASADGTTVTTEASATTAADEYSTEAVAEEAAN